MTGPICLVVGAKCGSKLGISSFICMVIPIFLPPPSHSDWGWCNSIPIWNMRPAPGPAAECLIHNWLTLTFSQQSRCPSLQTVQSSDYSYQSPSNDVFTMADYQHRVSNCDFNENWHETKSGKQCESVISAMLQSTITGLAYLGIFQIHMIKTSRPRIEEGCILVPAAGLWSPGPECRVSCIFV